MDSTSLLILFSVSIIAIGAPLYLIKWYKEKHKLPLKVALFGAGFFILVQIIHIPIVLLTQNIIFEPLFSSFGEFGAILGLAIYLGLLAALFEEPARYIIFSKIMKEQNLENAKLFGLGWGGIEAILLVGLLAPVSVLLTEQFFSTMDEIDFEQVLIDQGVSAEDAAGQSAILADQKVAFENQSPFIPLASLYERILAMSFHICASILVMASIMKKEWAGFIAAFILHFVLDFSAVFLIFTGGVIIAELGLTIIVGGTILYTARYLGVQVPELAK